MNLQTNRIRLEDAIQLAKEWKDSGMTQAAFAFSKGITLRVLEYRIKKVRDYDPAILNEEPRCQVEFASVKKEVSHLKSDCITEAITDQPVLMIQSAGACLQATNGIDPYLLKTALEVMLTC